MRVIVVDDHDLVRAGIIGQIDGKDGISVVGEAGDVDSAVQAVTSIPADVVLLDVHLPGGRGGGGAEVIRRSFEESRDDAVGRGGGTAQQASGAQQASEAQPGALNAQPIKLPRFLALSISDAADDVVSVVRAGARGYVTKSINGPQLIEALQRVDEGDAAFSPRLAGFVLDAFGAAAGVVAARDEELDRLTAREQEVMRLIARGYTYREIAAELFISIKTVESHVSACLRKLQLSNRRELSRWATARGVD